MGNEVVEKNNDVVDVTTSEVFVSFQDFIHVFLHVGRTSAVTHENDVKPFLTSMTDDSCFSSIAFANMTLIESLLQIDNCDPWFISDGMYDIVLTRERVSILNYDLIEISQIYNRSSFAFVSDDEDRLFCGNYAIDR